MNATVKLSYQGASGFWWVLSCPQLPVLDNMPLAKMGEGHAAAIHDSLAEINSDRREAGLPEMII